MLRVIAKRTGYGDGFDNLRMDKVSVAPFAASVDEACCTRSSTSSRIVGGTTSPFAGPSPHLLSIPEVILARVQ